jgi:putative acetyltransferase
MTTDNFQIIKYTNSYRTQITEIWEKSVLATHAFLRPDDFDSIKEFVNTMDFSILEVYCLIVDSSVAGFIGIAEQKVEMLFLSPDYFGKGMGQKLIRFAISELGAEKVDVNEQNVQAVGFYKKMGFVVYERTEKDDQGRDYPLLRMKLAKN